LSTRFVTQGRAKHKRLIVLLLCVACANVAHAQGVPSVVGNYAGTFGTLHLRLRVWQSAKGELGAMGSVDQGPFDITCEHVTFSGRRFSFVVPSVGGTYKGQLSEDGNTITGTWNQGTPGPLVFTRRAQANAASLRPQLAAIDSLVADDFNKNRVGSVTVGVVSSGHLIWTKSYGDADTDKHIRANQGTVYRIGSITKMFTALMLEQMIDAGKVRLSDPVEKYFPEVDLAQGRYPNAPPITLMQLATHTSGLAREPDDAQKYVEGPVADWEKILIAALPHLHYIYEPGTRFSYSNIGYAILGAALARAAGEPYLKYVPEHIFKPLGMTRSALELAPSVQPYLSSGYQTGDNGSIDAATPLREQAGRGYKVPNGAIYTTVGDLAKFASFLMGEGPSTVLAPDRLEYFQDALQVTSTSRLNAGYGIGFSVMRRGDYVVFGHGGAVAGYNAALFINRDEEFAVIALANALGPKTVDTQELALRCLDVVSKPKSPSH
jgi:CubicO group peptidase (beta-lactamase class C family)